MPYDDCREAFIEALEARFPELWYEDEELDGSETVDRLVEWFRDLGLVARPGTMDDTDDEEVI